MIVRWKWPSFIALLGALLVPSLQCGGSTSTGGSDASTGSSGSSGSPSSGSSSGSGSSGNSSGTSGGSSSSSGSSSASGGSSSGSSGSSGSGDGATVDAASCGGTFLAALDKKCSTDTDCTTADHNDCCGTVVIGIRAGTQAAFAGAEQAFMTCEPGCGLRGCFHATLAESGQAGPDASTIVVQCDAGTCITGFQ